MRLVIRAHASAKIGFGHVMRCVALAEVAADHDIPVTFTGEHDDGAEEAIRARGFELSPELEQRWPAGLRPSDVVMFDGYRFTQDDYTATREIGVRVGAIDDQGEGAYPVDVLLHQNLATSLSFDVPDGTAVLVGPRYALVRKEFRSRRRLRTRGDRLLLTLGGADPCGLGAQLIEWVIGHGQSWDITVLLGPAAPQLTSDLDAAVVRAPGDVGRVFDQADVVIAAAGSTTWELCCMGIPSLLVQVAHNQRYIGRPVAELGAAVFLGEAPIGEQDVTRGLDHVADPARRRELSERSMQLVDGQGAARVFDALLG